MGNLDLHFLHAELNRISDWIKFSDQKTGFISAYYSIFIGFLISQKGSISQSLLTYDNWELCLYSIIFISVIISLLGGLLFLSKSVFPKLTNSYTDESLFYFKHIANKKFVDYVDDVMTLSEETAKKQILEQIYTNSTIANLKMQNVQKSISWLIVLAFFIVLLVILGV